MTMLDDRSQIATDDSGGTISVRISGPMLSQIDRYRAERGLLHRGEVVRQLLAVGLEQEEMK